MASLPYVTAPGNVTKALNGISDAATPQKVSQDFVKEILKIPGGSGTQMNSYLKKVGLAETSGTPTALYTKFRNPHTRGQAAADILRHGYPELYERNEYCHELSDAKLKGLIIEVTGHEATAAPVSCIASCFKNIKAFADFDQETKSSDVISPSSDDERNFEENGNSQQQGQSINSVGVGLNLGYTINLNLPATSDIAVFNAIFKSLKENLLK